MTFERAPHVTERATSLVLSLKMQVEAGMPVKVKPMAQAIGISAANLYSMIAAEKVEVSRPSERRIVIPPHEARRLLGMKPDAIAA